MTQKMNEQNFQRSRQEIEAQLVAKAWKDETFKQELLANPKATIEQEFGVQLPEALKIQIMEEDTETLYITLPSLPELNQEELSDRELEAVAGGATPLAVAGVTAAGSAFTFGAAAKEGSDAGW